MENRNDCKYYAQCGNAENCARCKGYVALVDRNEYLSYVKEMGRKPDFEVEFIPLDFSEYPSLSETTKRIVDTNFTWETIDNKQNYCVTGHWLSDLSYQFAQKCGFDLVRVDGYRNYAYSDEQMAIFEYCEGDIYFTPYNDKAKYEKAKESTIRFYKEEM